jgi:mono/diheme cytochrome c family protein
MLLSICPGFVANLHLIMPAFDWRLNDAQVAAVLTFIRNSWKNAASPVSTSTITNQRALLAETP